MSDSKETREFEDKGPEAAEPQAGEGTRSLHNWQGLAQMRQALSGDSESLEAYRADPQTYMQRFGVNPSMFATAEGMALSGSVPSMMAYEGGALESDLAFCKVWGVVIVVAAAAAAAAAAVVAAANAAAAANAVALANVWVTVNTTGSD